MQALEEYIANMENRGAIDGSQVVGEDVWTQLRQKENDLQLAAELGKALLEKNEELKKQYDAAVEEYSKNLEVRDDWWYNSDDDDANNNQPVLFRSGNSSPARTAQ